MRVVIKTLNNSTSFSFCEKITPPRRPRLCGAPRFHQKASISVLFTLSFVTKKKKSLFFPSHSAVIGNRLSPCETLRQFAAGPALPVVSLEPLTCAALGPSCAGRALWTRPGRHEPGGWLRPGPLWPVGNNDNERREDNEKKRRCT